LWLVPVQKRQCPERTAGWLNLICCNVEPAARKSARSADTTTIYFGDFSSHFVAANFHCSFGTKESFANANLAEDRAGQIFRRRLAVQELSRMNRATAS
jgi:hypothetical protein